MARAKKKPKYDINTLPPGSKIHFQLKILKIMYDIQKTSTVLRQYPVQELAKHMETTEEGEIIRALYILEGQKFVSPYPSDDFTSTIWTITENGITAIDTSDFQDLSASLY